MESVLIESDKNVGKKLNDIVYLEFDSNFTKAHYFTGEVFIIENNFKKIEESLPDEKFFRVNESSVINADYLKKIKVSTSKNVLMQKGIEINISQNRYSELIEFMKIKYCI
ncbi:LytR/AlgR family response regulator transcription factor [Bacteroidota bacterium]